MEVAMLDRLVEIFCEVDDFCKAFEQQLNKYSIDDGAKPRGPEAGLCESEIIVILTPIMGFVADYCL
jgi:hypothetical protein